MESQYRCSKHNIKMTEKVIKGGILNICEECEKEKRILEFNQKRAKESFSSDDELNSFNSLIEAVNKSGGYSKTISIAALKNISAFDLIKKIGPHKINFIYNEEK